jgi:hypothetical protein
LGSWVFMLWEKLWPLNESSSEKSRKPNSHKNQTHEKHESEVGEPSSDSCPVSRATRVHQPHVLQTSVHQLHRMRIGRWLSAGVSEINLSNPAHNDATRGCLHTSLHFTIWPSGTWSTTGKTWTWWTLCHLSSLSSCACHHFCNHCHFGCVTFLHSRRHFVHTQSSYQCLPFLPSCNEYASFVVEEQAWI